MDANVDSASDFTLRTTATFPVQTNSPSIVSHMSDSPPFVPRDATFTVKPLPPFSVRVTNAEGLYNITWDIDNTLYCLTYKVRVRESDGWSKVRREPREAPDVGHGAKLLRGLDLLWFLPDRIRLITWKWRIRLFC